MSNPVNEAIAVIMTELGRLKALALAAPLEPADTQKLLAFTDQLRQIEHGRGTILVAAIAGRKALDKLAPEELSTVVAAISGIEPKETK